MLKWGSFSILLACLSFRLAWYMELRRLSPVLSEYGGVHCLAEGQKDSFHTDYFWLIPKTKISESTFCGLGPPVFDYGNLDRVTVNNFGKWGPKPIPAVRQWGIQHLDAPLKNGTVKRLYYFAAMLPGFIHIRFGDFRWNDVDDNYTAIAITAKKVQPNLDIVHNNWEMNKNLAILKTLPPRR